MKTRPGHRALLYIFTSLLFLAILSTSAPHAQTQEPDPGSRVLITGVDINGQGFPLAIVDLRQGTATTLITFANRPACAPAVFPGGETVLYEPAPLSSPTNVYRINTATGERNALPFAPENRLSCPVVSPDGTAIAWIDHSRPEAPEGVAHDTLVITDPELENPVQVTSADKIFDVQWSPGSSVLVYQTTTAESPFLELHSVLRSDSSEPKLIWPTQQGIVQDYIWVNDSTGLLIAYYTESELNVGVLSVECIIGTDEACEPQSLASFATDSTVSLLSAFSPVSREMVISVQRLNPVTNRPISDLWLIDLTGEQPPEQLTFTPDIYETEAHWSTEGDAIYFIGSQLEEDNTTFRGRIFRLVLDSDAPAEIIFESTIFSPGSFLWWYH